MTDYEFASKNVYRISKEHMQKLFEIFNVKNIAELRTKLDSNFVPDLSTDIDFELKKQRLEKMKIETKIKQHELMHIETFGTRPSPQAQQAINQYHKSKPIVQPDGSFRCPRCQRRFAESEVYKQVDLMYSHMKNDHHSDYTDSERAEILAVIEN